MQHLPLGDGCVLAWWDAGAGDSAVEESAVTESAVMKNAVSKSAGLSLFLGGIGSAAAQFCQNGGGYGKQEDTGQAQKFAACKHAQQGGCGGKAHLKADDFRLQGLADHCNQQIEAHKADTQAS